AEGVVGPSVDFNVMVAGRLPPPRVVVALERWEFDPAGALLCLFALQATIIDELAVGRHDLVTTPKPCAGSGPVLAVWIAGA
ncbi:MAG: hypothetical protein ACRC14_00410, partial [Paracoccaceae bacterium]